MLTIIGWFLLIGSLFSFIMAPFLVPYYAAKGQTASQIALLVRNGLIMLYVGSTLWNL